MSKPVSCDVVYVSFYALPIEMRSIFSKINLILQLFDSYLHSLYLEEIESLGYNNASRIGRVFEDCVNLMRQRFFPQSKNNKGVALGDTIIGYFEWYAK